MHYLLHPEAEAAKGQVTLSDEAMLAQLQDLAGSSNGGIELLPMPEADREPYLQQPADSSSLTPRHFKGAVARDWRVASFTSLATRLHHAAELPDRDEGNRTEPQSAKGIDPSGIFAFPRGAKAGIFLHEIFERLDFTASPEALALLVAGLLDRHGFAPEWGGAVCSMVQNVLQAPLGEESFTLARIPMERRLTELEFFFPLAAITSERLSDAVARFSGQPFPVDMAGLFSRLSFAPVQGMLRGFVDLVVEKGGRYYILDWKSNHLGNAVEDYDLPGMRREMELSLYPLQYLLYTVALDHYLKLRIPEYDYDRHFGGIFYIFLRGVDGRGNGIFADRPPKRFIDELSDALIRTSTLVAP
jgi:exodeoxyribonuclease V beta subunit